MVEGINWTTFVVESSSSTDWTTVLVALITGLTAAAGPALMHVLQGRKERLAVRAALIAEVTALASIIRARRYCEDLQETIQQLKQGHTVEYFKVPIPEDYNLIYRQNADKLGCLPADEAAEVVRFYKLVMAVIADMSPGGALYEGEAGAVNYAENLGLLRAALSLADGLAERG